MSSRIKVVSTYIPYIQSFLESRLTSETLHLNDFHREIHQIIAFNDRNIHVKTISCFSPHLYCKIPLLLTVIRWEWLTALPFDYKIMTSEGLRSPAVVSLVLNELNTPDN